MPNTNLSAAKRAKNDEFYTQWADIEREMNAYLEYDPDVFRGKTILLPCDDPEWSNFCKFFALHFTGYGIKRLIATSYANGAFYSPTDAELSDPHYDPELSMTHGRVFELTDRDLTGDGRVNIDDLSWRYLEGDGDFRSTEVTAFRDQADMVITNPPFSLFREFMAWLIDGGVQFSVLGSQNAITYKEIFPLIQGNVVWLGTDCVRWFQTPGDILVEGARSRWFTNVEHGRRHERLDLLTQSENLRYSKHLPIRQFGYQQYDNYDAIEVPSVDAIPGDYDGVMGVPITFLDKYNPEQFEVLGASQRGCHDLVPDTKKYDDYREMKPDGTPTGSSGGKTNENANLAVNDGHKNYFINTSGHVVQSAYQRIFICHRNPVPSKES